jgi:hypothetical protein
MMKINVVSVNLSASMVFLLKGIRPGTWLEKNKARQSSAWVVIFWTISLLILFYAVYIRNGFSN